MILILITVVQLLLLVLLSSLLLVLLFLRLVLGLFLFVFFLVLLLLSLPQIFLEGTLSGHFLPLLSEDGWFRGFVDFLFFWLIVLVILIFVSLDRGGFRLMLSINTPIEQSVLAPGRCDEFWLRLRALVLSISTLISGMNQTKSVALLSFSSIEFEVAVVSVVVTFNVIGEVATTHAILTILSHVFLLLSQSFSFFLGEVRVVLLLHREAHSKF